MFCKNCGAKLDEDAAFCEKCGTPIRHAKNSGNDLQNEVSCGDGQTSQGESGTVASPVASGLKKRSGILLVIAITVVIVVGLAFSALHGRSAARAGNSMADCNFNNGGKLAFDDKTLYFVGCYEEDDPETCVYSMSYSGNQKVVISEDPTIERIRLANEKILYESVNDTGYTIGMMEKDGSKNSVIVELPYESDHNLKSFDASASSLYYLYGDELREHPISGGEELLLADGVEDFLLADDVIFYATESSIFSYNMGESESIEICNSPARMLALSDGKIYFKNGDAIYKVALTGKENEELVVEDTQIGRYVVTDSTIYYIQMLEADEMVELANSIGEEDSMALLIALIGSGAIKEVPKEGGTGELVESDQALVSELYAYPEGLYSKWSSYSDRIVPVKIG